MAHWSKSRHYQYESCPRQFFYENIASERNVKFAALRGKTSPSLARHEVVRRAVAALVRQMPLTTDSLARALESSRTELSQLVADPLDVAAQHTIVAACLERFVSEM